jgi:hypothetical protein
MRVRTVSPDRAVRRGSVVIVSFVRVVPASVVTTVAVVVVDLPRGRPDHAHVVIVVVFIIPPGVAVAGGIGRGGGAGRTARRG